MLCRAASAILLASLPAAKTLPPNDALCGIALQVVLLFILA